MISLEFVIESSICLLLFYGFFWFFLRKETCFQWNRLYLILTPLLSILFPLLYWTTWTTSEVSISPSIDTIATGINAISNPLFEEISSASLAGWVQVLRLFAWIYIVVGVLLLVKLVWSLFLLLRVMIQGRTSAEQDYYIIEHNVSIPMSSFFRYIFWDQPKGNKEQEMILAHELVHVRQHHSVDRLWMEFWKIVFWFHPGIYLIGKALRESHEYIADHHVATTISSAESYARLLVDQSKLFKSHRLVNNFYSLTKNRLIMLGTSASSWSYKLKFVLLIPFLMMVAGFCILDVAKPNQGNNLISNTVQVEGQTVHLSPIKIEWGSIKKEKGVISLRTFTKSCKHPIKLLINKKYVLLEKLEINLLKENKEVISIKAPGGIIPPAQIQQLTQLKGDAEIFLENITIIDDTKSSKRIPNIAFQIKDLRK